MPCWKILASSMRCSVAFSLCFRMLWKRCNSASEDSSMACFFNSSWALISCSMLLPTSFKSTSWVLDSSCAASTSCFSNSLWRRSSVERWEIASCARWSCCSKSWRSFWSPSAQRASKLSSICPSSLRSSWTSSWCFCCLFCHWSCRSSIFFWCFTRRFSVFCSTRLSSNWTRARCSSVSRLSCRITLAPSASCSALAWRRAASRGGT
mmetsp:Transcript_54943/g.131255  ORF Transcript_54943/g.131255 Transcript_54943/m.131255 type:complete len:208 (+) Transcript_54943:124-747(+)